MLARAANRLIATVSFAILEVAELPNSEDLRQAAKGVAVSYWTPMQGSARRLRHSLQDLDPNDVTYSTADSTFAESVSAAASFGDKIARALERLADSLYKETQD